MNWDLLLIGLIIFALGFVVGMMVANWDNKNTIESSVRTAMRDWK